MQVEYLDSSSIKATALTRDIKPEFDGKPVGECLHPDVHTDGQVENIMPPNAAILDGRRHKPKLAYA